MSGPLIKSINVKFGQPQQIIAITKTVRAI
jgi:hypothetical protein